MRRTLSWLAPALVWWASWTAPASAHASFSGPGSYPAGTDQRLTLEVPHERDDSTYNVGVSVAVPAGWGVRSCESEESWGCEVAPPDADGRSVVTWTKAAGAPAGPNDETFRFDVRTGSPGRSAFPVVQTYSTGEKAYWTGSPDSEEPAPVLETVAAGAPTTAAPTTTTPTHEPVTTTAAPATSITTGGASTTSPAPPTSTPAAPSTTGPSTTGPSTTGPSTTGPSTTGPSTTVPPTVVSPLEGSTTTEPRTGRAGSGEDGGGSSGAVPLLVAAAVGLLGGGLWLVARRGRSGRS